MKKQVNPSSYTISRDITVLMILPIACHDSPRENLTC